MQYPPHVPDELMLQLHQATDQFHRSRKRLEAAMDSSDFGHQEHINTAIEQLRRAEGEVEAVEEEITKILSSDA